MVDLNAWQLDYPGVSLPFGTHESGFPFTSQVAVGAVAVESSDRAQPTGDGMVPGADYSRGRILGFKGAHLPTDGSPASRAWVAPLNAGNTLEAVWAASSLAHTEGAVATLTNLDRSRLVYGRPRNYLTSLDRVRRGWSEWSAEFHTIDRWFYSAVEHKLVLSTIAAHVGGITTPVVTPVGTTDDANDRQWINATGGAPAWPRITFIGPCTNPRMTLLSSTGTPLWTLWFAVTLAAGQTATVDTRPFSRIVTAKGAQQPGLLRGDPIDLCTLPPGTTQASFTVTTDPSGTAAAWVEWRDTFPGL